VGEPKPVTAADVERLKEWLDESECCMPGEGPCPICVSLRMVRSTLEIHKPVPMGVDNTILACPFCVSDLGSVYAGHCPTVSALVRCLPEEVTP
jgi:hypothetical protein